VNPAIDESLAAALQGLALPGVLIGHRVITPDDSHALTAEEAASLPSRLPEAQRASAAARIVARELLAQMGVAATPLPRAPSGAPIWPPGFVGSLAHDDCIAVAAVARRAATDALGIDVEPAGPLPTDLLDVVATARERLVLYRDPSRGRLLFAAKEAVYKAISPLDGVFLEYYDIEVDFAANRAKTRQGRTLILNKFCTAHVVVLARLA
jgi:4'-phosphopantetheinyl transferase EntD